MISGKEKDKATDEELFWIKIIDFGTAKIFDKNKKEKDVVGSSYYIAPEVLKKIIMKNAIHGVLVLYYI